MFDRQTILSSAILCVLVLAAPASAAQNPDDVAAAAVRKIAQQLAKSFNAGKADEVAQMFLPKGELIDEEGAIYQGRQEIKSLLTAFFTRYPGAKLTLDIETVRVVGPIAIEEGTRTMATADGAEKSRFRYIAVWAKAENGWSVASFRDFKDDPATSPHDRLQPIAWLVGDWVNEGADGKVTISYRWSEDKNFLLGDFKMQSPDGTPRTSTQRIGWDPAANRIRSWLFDSDGGFSEGQWTVADEQTVIKSSSVNPDGVTATATMYIVAKDKDHFSIEGTDRVVGDNLEPDFEITVTRQAPAASK
jgi:uncharacterized protein (TIGR02246 family)